MIQTLILPSPAKINLFLHVVGRRPDGYHLLQTVFQFIDICDTLSFKVRNDHKILLKSNTDIPEEQNLIKRAAQILQQQTNTSLGAEIDLDKCIPIGGGLGGGSSNAATTLLALNHLWQTKLSREQLFCLGLQLGADVPIFLHGQSAFAEGVGEKLENIKLEEPWYFLVIPRCSISTAKIFSVPELTRNTPMITISEFQKRGGHNDCESVVRKYYPEVDEAFNWLNQFAPTKMTGTGSCVYASFDTKIAALELLKQLPTSFQGVVTKGLSVSPLIKALMKRI